MLVIWAYQLDDIIPTYREFEDKLIKLVWNRRSTFSSAFSLPQSTVDSVATMKADIATEKAQAEVSSSEIKNETPEASKESKQKVRKARSCGLRYWTSGKNDVEKRADGPSSRPTRLFAAVYAGIATALSICK